MKRRRRGFSLMEVILSIAIMASATVLLGQLTRLGMHNASRARDLTAGELLCESKLNEIVAALEPAEAVQDATFDTTVDPDQEWKYTIAVSDINTETGLIAVTVTVNQNVDAKMKPIKYSLTRWMIPIASTTEEEESTDSTSSSSSSSSSSSGASSSGASGGGQSATP